MARPPALSSPPAVPLPGPAPKQTRLEVNKQTTGGSSARQLEGAGQEPSDRSPGRPSTRRPGQRRSHGLRWTPPLGATTITDRANTGPCPSSGSGGGFGWSDGRGWGAVDLPPWGLLARGPRQGRRPRPAASPAHQPCSDGLVGQVYWRRN